MLTTVPQQELPSGLTQQEKVILFAFINKK